MNCQKCNGSGLILRKVEYNCSFCTKSKTNSCFRCERKDKSKYTLCEKCEGKGL
jgi:hypothetical protein